LLWIWPDRSTTAFSDAENSSIPIENDLADYLERAHEEGVFIPFVRHFPFSFDALMENGFDASHLQTTHHGAMPAFNRYETAPIHAELTERTTDERRTFFVKYSNPPVVTTGNVEVSVPGTCVYHDIENEGASLNRTYLTCSPTSKGRSLVVFILIPESQISSTKKSNIIQKALSPFLNVAYHLLGLEIGDADIAILTNQDRKTKVEGFEVEKGFYLPTSADIGVLAFRKWFETEGERGAVYGGNELENHTKHCKLCSSALKTTETVISVLRFVRLAAAFLGGALLLRIAETGSVPRASVLKSAPIIVSVLVLCCSIAAIHLLNKLRAQFYYRGYDFAERN